MESTRLLFLDTETTGLDPNTHRLVEIGVVEAQSRWLTGRTFHTYLNPERPVDPGAFAVHGLSDAFLASYPVFSAVAADFLAFLQPGTLVIHNAAFDLGFLNTALQRWDPTSLALEGVYPVIDSLMLARKKHRGQRNTLDALCKRYRIDTRDRTLHGALLDARLLAEVYLAMTRGAESFALTPIDPKTAPDRGILADPGRIYRPTPEEHAAHALYSKTFLSEQ